MANVSTILKTRKPLIILSEGAKIERARSPGKIQAGDSVSMKEAIELVRNGAGVKHFKSPFWYSSGRKGLKFKATPCYGDCCPENGMPISVMLVIGYSTNSSNPLKKKLIRICTLCGSLREEEEIKRKPKNNQPNQGGNHGGGDNTK